MLALHLVAPLVIGAILAALYGGGTPSVDGMWSLVWGRDLLALAPLSHSGTTTPHLLANLLGAALAPLRGDADYGLIAATYVGTGALVWAAGLLAREVAGTAAGIAGGVLVATREQLLYATTSAFLDVFSAALIVIAMLLLVRAPSRPARAAVVLLLAGLMHPQAWLLAIALWGWQARRSGSLRPGLLALVLAAPALWFLGDWLLTGDLLFSSHETNRVGQLIAAADGASRGLGVRLTGWPVGIARAAGPEIVVLAALALVALTANPVTRHWPWFALLVTSAQRRQLLGLFMAAGVLAAGLLAESIGGTRPLSRYCLPVGALLCVIVAASARLALRQWSERPGRASTGAGDQRRAFAVVIAVLVAVQLPLLAWARHVTSQRRDLILEARAAIHPGVACRPVVTPNANLRAAVAVWADVPARSVIDGATQALPPHATFVTAVGSRPQPFLRDRHFPQRSGFPPLPVYRSLNGWVLTSSCAAAP